MLELFAGSVHVILKDSIFEASSPTRHTAELGKLMKTMYPNAVALVIYTDGGPDHNCKHTSVRLGLLSLFLELDLDTMVVMRTAPTQSWGNPVERVMSVLNLGLQGVALARDELIGEDFEKDFHKCNGMGAVREVAKAYKKNVVEPAPVSELGVEGIDVIGEEQREQEKERLLMIQQQEEEDAELMLLLRTVETVDENHLSVLEEEEQLAFDEVVSTSDAFANGSEMDGVRAHAVDDDDDMWGEDIDREVDIPPLRDSSHAQPPLVPNNSTSSARPPSEANNPFIDAYMVSIKPAREIICGQWSECICDEKNLNIDAPATIDEVGFMLLTLMHLILMIVMLLLLNLLLMITNACDVELCCVEIKDEQSIGRVEGNPTRSQAHQVGQEACRGIPRASPCIEISRTIHRLHDSILQGVPRE